MNTKTSGWLASRNLNAVWAPPRAVQLPSGVHAEVVPPAGARARAGMGRVSMGAPAAVHAAASAAGSRRAPGAAPASSPRRSPRARRPMLTTKRVDKTVGKGGIKAEAGLRHGRCRHPDVVVGQVDFGVVGGHLQ